MQDKTTFSPTPQRLNFSKEEQLTLAYWNKIKAFEGQLKKTQKLPPYTFYDGPPFATGTPHYGHIAAGTIKDVVCRYACQSGHSVQRRFGWDCHGLPIEYEIDKDLGIKTKQEVLKMGIDKYNNHCRNIVMRFSQQWENVVQRFGRWIDFKNDYKTMDSTFMESVWFVFKNLYDKGLVYRGKRIMPYSNACNTVLSNFQVQQNYKQISDPSLFITFPLKKDPSVKLLAWTTTPWTLPSNLALAVHPELTYLKIKDQKRNQIFIVGESRVQFIYEKQKYEVIEKIKGKELEGLQYIPLFDFFLQRSKDGCFKILTADFVTDSDGTGIVHCAPGFGQEDFKLCVEKKIITPGNPPVPVDDNGSFTEEVHQYKGIYVKDADKIIIKDLKAKGRIFHASTVKHNYPFCWRSETPLIYKAVSAWFIKVTEIKEDLIENNKKAYWVPKVIQDKKFNNWLKDAKDWCFSRNRFWGNPIPLWVSEDGEEVVCIGSLKELEELTGKKVTDLHREHLDDLTIQSKQGKGKLRRIQQVFDCWFQSGAMPFAQVHYPFSTSEEEFEKIFPADFIGEGIDQTRGWFYTLNVISTGVRNSHPYKNLIVNGLVLNEDGKKMSKRLKNYPDPLQVCGEYGADAVRLYLINSPLVRADNLNFSTKGVQSVVKNIFLPWYNVYRFLIQNIKKWESFSNKKFIYIEEQDKLQSKFNITDKWILSSLQILIKEIRKQMGEYKLYNVAPKLVNFLQQLTNWYVRLNRNRIKGEIDEQNMQVSLNVLMDVLHKINLMMSCIVPFLTEHFYQNLKKVIREDSTQYEQSIHHLFIPEVDNLLIDTQIPILMKKVQDIIEVGRKLREEKKISLKQPITSLTIVNKDQNLAKKLGPFFTYLESELNVDKIMFETNTKKYIQYEALPNLAILGPRHREYKPKLTAIKNKIKELSSEAINNFQAEKKMVIEGETLTSEDLLIKEKFVKENVHEYEIIGGQSVIILLDTRQDEELKRRGLARELINRIQKLKKECHLQPEDPMIVLIELGENSKKILNAIDKQHKLISNAIKRPLLRADQYNQEKVLAEVNGRIDGELYSLRIGEPVLNGKSSK